MKKFPIAVQSYTVREAMDKDYEGALRRISKIGYKGIELGFPPDGMTVSEQKALLSELNLHVVGTHGPFNSLDFNPNDLADYLEAVNGGKFVVLSMMLQSKSEILTTAKRLNQIGEQLSHRGITLLYHNHDWDFTQFDGEYALDLLLNETNPMFLQTEPDVYWIKRGGEDPATYLGKLKNRAPLLHIKDMEPGDDAFFAEVGEGVLDFPAILEVAEAIGVRCLVVEQDFTRRDPFDCLQTSFDNLRKLGVVAP